MRAWSFAAGLGMVATVAVLAFAGDPVNPRVVPDAHLTPGMVASTDESDVCAIVGGLSYSKRHRLSQNPQTKHEVLERYGVAWADRARYEDDHDVPLALGGSDDVANRWPQPRFGTWTAAMKDKLETRAWEMVCHEHTLNLLQAQQLFLAPADWRESYCRVVANAPCSDLVLGR